MSQYCQDYLETYNGMVFCIRSQGSVSPKHNVRSSPRGNHREILLAELFAESVCVSGNPF